jgi:putative ABC transport system ATP-binding protein
MEGEHVLEHVSAPLLAQGVSPRQARRAADAVLDRTSVGHCAGMHPDELDGSERVRVAVARALATSPAILIVDDPTAGVGLLQVDGILRMLRTLAKDENRGVLMSTNDAMCISGADRALSLDDGQLRGEKQQTPAAVIPLMPRPIGAGPQAYTG